MQDQVKAQAYAGAHTADESIKSVMAVERELADNLDMIEMVEAEGDYNIVAESQAIISRLFSEAKRMEVDAYPVKRTQMTVIWKFMPVPGQKVRLGPIIAYVSPPG